MPGARLPMRKIRDVLRLGASGIVPKQSPAEFLFKCIRGVHAGEIWLDSDTTAAEMQRYATGVSDQSTPTTDAAGSRRIVP